MTYEEITELEAHCLKQHQEGVDLSQIRKNLIEQGVPDDVRKTVLNYIDDQVLKGHTKSQSSFNVKNRWVFVTVFIGAALSVSIIGFILGRTSVIILPLGIFPIFIVMKTLQKNLKPKTGASFNRFKR